jgi:cytochrome c peroxidase
MNFRAWRGYALIALGLAVLGAGLYYLWPRTFWSEAEVATLRGVAERAPYMHAGQFATLEEVLRHYSLAPAAPAGHNELEFLNLSETQIRQLIAFLRRRSAPRSISTKRQERRNKPVQKNRSADF